MKICKYCGGKNKNSAESCTSCGGAEFKYICENCRTEFDKGAYCPVCGVKAGRVARTCPECGEIYFTKACPECGYTQSRPAERYQHHTVSEDFRRAPQKSRASVGIILLWIFFLPIMAGIAIWRSRWSTKYKVIATAVLLLLCVGAGASGEGGDAANEEPEVIQGSAIIQSAAASNTLSRNVATTPDPEYSTELDRATPSPTHQPSPSPRTGYVNAKELNMRAAPSGDANVVQRFTYGQSLEILSEDGDWCKVSVGGITGYMANEYIGHGKAPDRAPEPENENEIHPVPETEPASTEPQEIPYKENYHGKVYTGGDNSTKYHYEAECPGKYSHEITWEEVSRRGLGPCGTCVAK